MTRVHEHKRTLPDGKQVTVTSHDRTGGDNQQTPPGDGRDTPAQQHRRERLRAESQRRHAEAMRRGKAASKKGWRKTKKQAKKTKRILRKGSKRLARAYHLAHQKKKLGAGMLAIGGIAEIGAALSYQLVGVAVTTVGIAVAVIGGGLLVGGDKSQQPKSSTKHGQATKPKQHQQKGKG